MSNRYIDTINLNVIVQMYCSLGVKMDFESNINNVEQNVTMTFPGHWSRLK